jgi:hypothetical protein
LWYKVPLEKGHKKTGRLGSRNGLIGGNGSILDSSFAPSNGASILDDI